jgi:hypothetical protein
MSSRRKKNRRRQILLRSLAIFGAFLLLLGILGAVGYQFFTGWRARDLAGKAKENFEKANYRMAWLQINSAKDLRGNEPEVLRVMGMIEAAIGNASALDSYEKLAQKTELTPEDLKKIDGIIGDLAMLSEKW